MLKDAGDGYAYVVNKSGLYLDVNGALSDNGTNVQGCTGNGLGCAEVEAHPVERKSPRAMMRAIPAAWQAAAPSSPGIDVSEHQGTGFNFRT